MVVHGFHDPALVMLSVLVAVAAAFTALDLGGRAQMAVGRSRGLWLAAAALAMGGGVWAMHFVAMLALAMPVSGIGYDPAVTLLSLLVAVAATGAGFAVVATGAGWSRLAGGGVLTGLGVAAMHYLGMAAMRMPLHLAYRWPLVLLSVLVAVVAATAALWLTGRRASFVQRVAAAAVMGLAVAGMHYVAMAAAVFTTAGAMHATAAANLGRSGLALGVAGAALLILLLALAAAMFDRRFAEAAARSALALQRSEERFRALYRGTPLPLHSLDADGRVEQVSKTWLELVGAPAAAVIGRPLHQFLTPFSAARLRDEEWPELLRQGELGPREHKLVTQDGRTRDVIVTVRIERDDAGGFLHALGGLVDVTEQRAAEQQLRQAQKLEAVGQLTGGIAHDFNNLLAVVIGNLDLLRHRLGPDDARAARLVDNALAGANRGAALTGRLLAFARRQDLRPEPVDVAQLVHGMSDLLQRTLGPMVQVEARFPLNLPPARADAHQLELALVNLGVNARDAMPDGGRLEISGGLEVAGPEAGLAPGHYIRLMLTDHGTGMDAETLARAVEPFFSTKGTGRGTGLGLSMVQGLAAQSGGRLVLRSQPGEGTTAELWLPVAVGLGAPRRDPANLVAVPDAQPVTPRRILVVDDDPLVLANTAAMLEDLGHQPVSAASGMEALARLSDQPTFDLLVTDQLMPHMTGTQLIARLRTIQPGMPALLVSGFSALAEPPADVALLRKPFTQAALAAAVAATPEPGVVVPLRPGRRA